MNKLFAAAPALWTCLVLPASASGAAAPLEIGQAYEMLSGAVRQPRQSSAASVLDLEAGRSRKTEALKRAAPPAGNWKIVRLNTWRMALATAGPGDTVATLAQSAGLEASQWRLWLTLPKGRLLKLADGREVGTVYLTENDIIKKGETVEIPNLITALWFGEFDRTGMDLVNWEPDLDYLQARGYAVTLWERLEGDEPRVPRRMTPGQLTREQEEWKREFLQTAIKKYVDEKSLHGVFITGHGSTYGVAANTKEEGVSWLRIAYWEFQNLLRYRLGFGIFNTCDGASGKSLLSESAAFYGISGLMIPIIQTGHPDEIVRPGDQGTWVEPQRERRRLR